MTYTRILLPTLDRIVPAAAIVAKEQKLSTNQREQLVDDIALMRRATQKLKELYPGVAGIDSPEAFFVRAAVGGGLNNFQATFHVFADMRDDLEVAGDVNRQILHPYLRLYGDLMSLQNDNYTSTAAKITIGGDDAHIAEAYYKTAPLPADIVEVSEAVYGLVFSALLLSAGDQETGQQEISLDFTSRAKGETGFIEVENVDGVFAGHLSAMVGKPKMQPTFLEQAFAAGMSVRGTIIRVPFARMV